MSAARNATLFVVVSDIDKNLFARAANLNAVDRRAVNGVGIEFVSFQSERNDVARFQIAERKRTVVGDFKVAFDVVDVNRDIIVSASVSTYPLTV